METSSNRSGRPGEQGDKLFKVSVSAAVAELHVNTIKRSQDELSNDIADRSHERVRIEGVVGRQWKKSRNRSDFGLTFVG